MICNDLEKEITLNMGSAMFGPPGAEVNRTGPKAAINRTLGIGWLLYAFVRASLPKTILEIGTGGSTACLLWGLKHNGEGHIHTCDVFLSGESDAYHLADCLTEPDGSPMNHNKADCIRMIKKWEMEDICTIYHKTSIELLKEWTDPVDMIVIDGDHSKEALENDVQFLNFLRPGGYAIFHDFLACLAEVGVTVSEWCKGDEWSLIVEPNCLSLGIVQRKFTLDPFGPLVAHRLSRSDNPNAFYTPIQFTNPRNCDALGKWNGQMFELEHFHDRQPEANKTAEEIMDYEQSTGTIVKELGEWRK